MTVAVILPKILLESAPAMPLLELTASFARLRNLPDLQTCVSADRFSVYPPAVRKLRSLVLLQRMDPKRPTTRV